VEGRKSARGCNDKDENQFTSVSAADALQVFLNVMRYINPRFTYLL